MLDKNRSVFTILGLLLIALLLPISSSYASENAGTITGSNLNVRTAPSTESEVVGKLTIGDSITIQSITGDWVGFSYNGSTAYVHKDYVKIALPEKTSQPEISVVVNGSKLTTPITPPLKDNRVLVPFRVIGEALGIEVKWHPETKQVEAIDGKKEILFTIDSTTVLVNGEAITSNPAPYIEQGHTVIPLRLFAENFGADVGWNADTKKVSIKRQSQNEEAPHKEETVIVPDVSKAPAKPQEPVGQERTIALTSVGMYKTPSLTSEKLTTLTKGQNVEVEAQLNGWVYVSYSSLKGYIPTDKKVFLEYAALTGTVKASELNVRDKPAMNGNIIGKLGNGTTTEIIQLDGSWAQIEIDGRIGYVHAYYLTLKKDGKAYTWLSEPTISKQTTRDNLTWKKQGTITTSHRIITGGIEISSNAQQVDAFTAQHPAIKDISIIDGLAGKTIKILLQDGYHVVVRHSIHGVEITLLKSGLAGKKIILDAGHGAKDPGATGPSGVQEKTVVLNVTLQLEKLLKEAGAEPILTRSNDTFLALSERVDFANAKKADAYISIHADSFNHTTQGSTTFYHSKNPSWQQAKKLSDIAIQKLTAKLGTVNRGSKDQSLHVIRETEMPAILVELAFLSNPNEEKKLNDSAYQQKAAQALYESLVEFYK